MTSGWNKLPNQRRTRRTMPMSRAFPLRIGWTTHSCACAAKTWAMRNDFDRRPVSDLGFMRLRLLGLLRRLRARQTRLACATGVSGMDPMRKNWQPTPQECALLADMLAARRPKSAIARFLYISESTLRRFLARARARRRAGKIEINLNQVSGAGVTGARRRVVN